MYVHMNISSIRMTIYIYVYIDLHGILCTVLSCAVERCGNKNHDLVVSFQTLKHLCVSLETAVVGLLFVPF